MSSSPDRLPPEQSNDLDAIGARRRRTVLIWAAVILGGLLFFGLFTWALGVGPFAYRVLLYDRAEIYILNMTDEPVEVTLGISEPVTVPPYDARRRYIYGGTTTLTTHKADGSLLEEVEVTTDGKPVVYNVAGNKCLALSDVRSFYTTTSDGEVEVLETFPKGTRIVVLPNTRVIWPRKTLLDEVVHADQGVAWIELVACPLLDPEERHVLTAHLNVLLTERKKKQRQEELRRKMMRERGSEAVDKQFEEERKALEDKQNKARDKEASGAAGPDAGPAAPAGDDDADAGSPEGADAAGAP